jgi:alginate O-acetyltransferase complex protein AlgI
MNFQNPFFLIFFLVIFLLYFKVPTNKRWIVLLVGSLFFYATLGIWYLFITLAVVVLISYSLGKKIYEVKEGEKKKWFVLGTVINVLILVVFRFYPVAVKALGQVNPKAVDGLPAGLAVFGVSFYVFQAISYLADIYLEIQDPERHLGYFAVYISFFPKVLQGPIERGHDLLPQLHEEKGFSYETAREGALQFAYGLFKKLVIADRLGVIVDPIYANVHGYSGAILLFATFVYAFQLYYDFSGYTDMSLGVAKIFNIRLTNNFNLPYLATSITEFWRRWHISFSHWIMDYLFKPIQLRLRRWGKWGVVTALMVTFLLSGLWHGVSWGYVVWGLLHGVYLSVNALYTPFRKRLYKRMKWEKSKLAKAWQVFLTFNLVSIAWIFFRASSISDAFYIVANILPQKIIPHEYLSCGKVVLKYSYNSIREFHLLLPQFKIAASKVCEAPIKDFSFFPGSLHTENISITLIGIAVAVIIGIWGRQFQLSKKHAWIRWGLYFLFALLIVASVLFLQNPFPSATPYLYGNY